ncbi:MAG: HAD-IA family hydrolase [Candidatus Azambacteria bacterium]|nr:HAD-IA family hydrolase [Candidatus Azambacteria bacterium]
MNKKAILFDADGVVIRSGLFGAYYQITKGISPDQMLPFYNGIFQECLTGKADLKEVIFPWLKKWKWNSDADDFLLKWFQYEDKADRKIVDLIQALQKNSVSCYLATNQEKYRTQYLRKKMGFEKLFDGIFSSAEMGCKKPERKFYEFIPQKLNLGKNKILYIDDSASNTKSASDIGIESYLYTEFEPFYEYVKPLLG